jgi:hypothetical protein
MSATSIFVKLFILRKEFFLLVCASFEVSTEVNTRHDMAVDWKTRNEKNCSYLIPFFFHFDAELKKEL